jgi:hypothetical protein
MTVNELIEKLKKLNGDSVILVQGYEDGLSDIGLIKESKAVFNVHSEDWNGPHEEDEKAENPVVILHRKHNPNSKS